MFIQGSGPGARRCLRAAGGPEFLDLWVSPKPAPVLRPSDFPVRSSGQLRMRGAVMSETVFVMSETMFCFVFSCQGCVTGMEAGGFGSG